MTSTGSGTGEQKDADAVAAPPPCSKNISAPLPPAAASSPGAAVHLVLSRLSGDNWLLPLGDSSEAELVSVGDAKSMLSRESENPYSAVLQPGRKGDGEGSSGGGGVAPFPASMVALLHAETFDELDDAVLLSKVDYSARMIFLGAGEWLSRCPNQWRGRREYPSRQLLTPMQVVWIRVITVYDEQQRLFWWQPWNPAWTEEQKLSARHELLQGALFLLDDAEYRTLVTTRRLSHLPPDDQTALSSVLTEDFYLSVLRCGLSRLPASDFLSAARSIVTLLCRVHVRNCFSESSRIARLRYGNHPSPLRDGADRLGIHLMYLGDLIAAHPQLEHRRSETERELMQLL